MKKVSTTDGPMYVAGSLWSLGALFIDLVMIQLIIYLAFGLVGQKKLEIGPWPLKDIRGVLWEGYAGKGTLLVLVSLFFVLIIGFYGSYKN